MADRNDGIVNILDLPIEWRHNITPYHEVRDPDLVQQLRASMEAHGWQGPPLVCDRDLFEVNQDQAYTGSHRIAAWALAQDDTLADMPCVFIQDIAEHHNIDLDALVDDNLGNTYAAVEQFVALLPDDVAEAYGLDNG
jgi:hypothetical protein